MNDESLLRLSEDQTMGTVRIAPEVIEVITGIAASEVKGLYAMRGNFASGVAERFGKTDHSKGVKVVLEEDGIVIDLYAILHFGLSIPKVAQDLQTRIRETLQSTTGLNIREINVHVVGMKLETNETPV